MANINRLMETMAKVKGLPTFKDTEFELLFEKLRQDIFHREMNELAKKYTGYSTWTEARLTHPVNDFSPDTLQNPEYYRYDWIEQKEELDMRRYIN